MKINNLIEICSWKKASLDEASSTSQQLKKGNKLYDCTKCKGNPGSCPNYISYNGLNSNYNLLK